MVFKTEALDDQNRQQAGDDGATDDAIHMEGFKPEHLRIRNQLMISALTKTIPKTIPTTAYFRLYHQGCRRCDSLTQIASSERLAKSCCSAMAPDWKEVEVSGDISEDVGRMNQVMRIPRP